MKKYIIFFGILGISILFNVLLVAEVYFGTQTLTRIPGISRFLPSQQKKVAEITPTVSNKPMLPGLSTYVHNVTGAGETDATYVVRMHLVGELLDEGIYVRGKGYIPADPKKTLISFALRKTNNVFILGYHTGGFSDFSQKIETVPFSTLKSKLPPGLFIQLRIATVQFNKLTQKVLISALESATKDIYYLPQIELPAYSVEIIGQK